MPYGREAWKSKASARACARCAVEFTPNCYQHKYCTERCRDAAHRGTPLYELRRCPVYVEETPRVS